MARRSCDVNTEPFGVVDRIQEGVHFHLTGIARAGIHLTDCQRSLEKFSFSLHLPRNWHRRLLCSSILARHNPDLQTFLNDAEHGCPPYRSFPAYERLKLLLMSGKSGMIFPSTAH